MGLTPLLLGARGALSVLTVKNLCRSQNYNLVLFGSKKMTRFANFLNSQLRGLAEFHRLFFLLSRP